MPLGLLWDRGQTLTTYPMNADGTGATSYDRASLSATLREILTPATEIYTLNPDTVAFMEHSDHIYAARITRVVAQSLKRNVPIGYHVTYSTGGLPKNLTAAETLKKRDVVGSYFAIDGNDAGHVFGEYMWDGNWVARRYWSLAHANDPGPEFQLRPFQLVNEYSSRCVESAGADRASRLAAYSGAPSQNWFWQQLPVAPGEKNDAQLVNAATRGCIAELDSGLVEQACSQTSAAQRWTPWDFGFVYTPLNHCLGEKAGILNAGRCAMLTTQYRWSPSPQSVWTDTRHEGALYGDMKGSGRDSVVYLQRRKDGPGFNVWVAEMSRIDNASPWYLNAVPFDSHAATEPTCKGDAFCFDSARFLLADFDGDGRADLMVIAPRNGGTAFWLLRSAGAHFEAPRLWPVSDERRMDTSQRAAIRRRRLQRRRPRGRDDRAEAQGLWPRPRCADCRPVDGQRTDALARNARTGRGRALHAGARRGIGGFAPRRPHPARGARRDPDDHPARHSGRDRLRTRGRRRSARAGVVALARRSARRHHLLSSLPHRAPRVCDRAALSRGSVPQHGHGSAERAYRRTYRLPLRQRPRGRHRARIGLLPRSVRAVASMNDQRRAAREGHAGEVRPPLCRRADQSRGGDGMARIYVPIDSAALALGAEGVAAAVASEAKNRGLDVQIVRNGSHGLFYLEPLVEVETANGRIGYANVEAEDVAALFDAGFHEGGAHEKNVERRHRR